MLKEKRTEFSEVIFLLNELCSKKNGQNLDNIIEQACKTYQWDANKTKDQLEKVEENIALKSVKIT